jgi:hypothetical protein
MMWTCESKHSNWWMHSNVLRLTAYIMQLLMKCCQSSHCSGYFVSTSNIFECSVSQAVTNQLTIFTELTHLTEWLMKYYIIKWSERYSSLINWQFDDVGRDTTLKHITESFLEHSHYYSLARSVTNTQIALSAICSAVSRSTSSLDIRTVEKWNEELRDIDRRLQPVFIAMFCLRQIATNYVVSEQSINLMSAVLTNFDNILITTEPENTNRRLLLKATRLTQMSIKTDDRTKSSILFILSYACLRRITYDSDCDCDVTHCLVNIHMAILYYISGHYHSAMRRCKLAIHEGAQVLVSFCSTNINDDIDIVLGLITLYQYIRQNASHQPSVPSYSHTMTVQLFAHYLLIVSHSASTNYCKDKLTNVLMKQYKLCLLNTPKTYSADFLFFYVLIKKWSLIDKNKIKTKSLSLKLNVAELRRLLLLLSVEQLTLFHQVSSRDYKSVCRIVTSTIEAMYAYRCDQYEQCLLMSQQNVTSLWHQKWHFTLPTFGCMTPIMSDGVVSLNAIYILSDPV